MPRSRSFDSLAWKLCALALVAVLACVLCSRMSRPWTYNDDYNGAFWSQAARNLSLGGYFSTAGVPAPLYFGLPPVPKDALYVHHPTLLSAMMLVDRAILGESEWAARALPALFSILTALLLWLFASHCAGWRGGALAVAFFVAAPMELHYGQMVNFEAPELCFLIAALCCYHLWRWRPGLVNGGGLILFCALSMWTDWQGYLLIIILVAELLIRAGGTGRRMGATLLVVACVSGLLFLLQIHLALPGAWSELLHAFRERSGHGDLSGGSFTTAQWLETEYGYLTTLYHPITWMLALGGVLLAYRERNTLSPREWAPLHIGGVLFLIDAFYICALRNQSYIHDFASFYFLAPIAVFSGFLIDRILHEIEVRHAGMPAYAATFIACVLVGVIIYSGIRRLNGIDTQFCMLDDNSDPALLMPDLGRLIDGKFAADAVIICNFDQYYSPLPYYARRIVVDYVKTASAWDGAVSDARPHAAGGVIWNGDPGAADLLRHLPAAELHSITVDGVAFTFWEPPAASIAGK